MDSFSKVDESIRNSENPTQELFDVAAYLFDPVRVGNERVRMVRKLFVKHYGDQIIRIMGGGRKMRLKVKFPALLVGIVRALYRVGMFPGVKFEELDECLGQVLEMPIKESSIRTMFYDGTSEYDELEKIFADYLRK